MIKKSNPRLSLDGAWHVSYGPNEAVDPTLSTIDAIRHSGLAKLPAIVPGNFELDLERAGVCPEIFRGCNVYSLYRYETYHQFYYRTFDYTPAPATRDVLVFEGIDCFAEIYIDGTRIGTSDNMLIPHAFPLPALTEGTHELVVHLSPAVLEARKTEIPPYVQAMRYSYDSLYVRKAPSQYGWDIMPRTVSSGIWKHVFIDRLPLASISDVYVQTLRLNEDSAFLKINYNCAIETGDIRDYSIRITGRCGDSTFSAESILWHTGSILTTELKNPRMWWPHNYGDANLYDVCAELFYKGTLVHTLESRVGIRMVELDRTSTTNGKGEGEFCFRVNGKKIFAMGTNWVPVDAYHSRDEERLPQILPMLTDIGCNIVRCWGGNVYENELFYDFCDENGIMVWQDFAMACGIYPQEDFFRQALDREIRAIVKLLRHHPSIVLWAGDNECDMSCFWGGRPKDPNENVLTRGVIPEALRIMDGTRPYLPSSPYMDETCFRTGAAPSEDHLWGPRDYFKGNYYKNTVAHFASETGYHGCPSPESLAKYISPEQLWPCIQENNVTQTDWICHAASMEPDEHAPFGYRIHLMWDQVQTLFGCDPRSFGSLEAFSQASQISQAEAKKYFIERFRLTKWRRTGIIWWNLIDGWPQISDAIVDYYLDKKLAYWYIQKSQQPFCMMFDEPVDSKCALYAVNDTREEKTVSYTVLDDEGKAVHTGTCTVRPDESVPVWYMPVGEEEKRFFTIRWNDGKAEASNHYFTNILNIDYAYYVRCARAAGYPMR